MKNFESKFGPKLTKDQMKKITGGRVPSCTIIFNDGSNQTLPCSQYDPDGNVIIEACEEQCDNMASAGLITGCLCG